MSCRSDAQTVNNPTIKWTTLDNNRDDDGDGRLREGEPPEAVHDRDPVDGRPFVAHTGDDLCEPSARGILVRLVRQRDDIVATLGPSSIESV